MTLTEVSPIDRTRLGAGPLSEPGAKYRQLLDQTTEYQKRKGTGILELPSQSEQIVIDIAPAYQAQPIVPPKEDEFSASLKVSAGILPLAVFVEPRKVSANPRTPSSVFIGSDSRATGELENERSIRPLVVLDMRTNQEKLTSHPIRPDFRGGTPESQFFFTDEKTNKRVEGKILGVAPGFMGEISDLVANDPEKSEALDMCFKLCSIPYQSKDYGAKFICFAANTDHLQFLLYLRSRGILKSLYPGNPTQFKEGTLEYDNWSKAVYALQRANLKQIDKPAEKARPFKLALMIKVNERKLIIAEQIAASSRVLEEDELMPEVKNSGDFSLDEDLVTQAEQFNLKAFMSRNMNRMNAFAMTQSYGGTGVIEANKGQFLRAVSILKALKETQAAAGFTNLLDMLAAEPNVSELTLKNAAEVTFDGRKFSKLWESQTEESMARYAYNLAMLHELMKKEFAKLITKEDVVVEKERQVRSKNPEPTVPTLLDQCLVEGAEGGDARKCFVRYDRLTLEKLSAAYLLAYLKRFNTFKNDAKGMASFVGDVTLTCYGDKRVAEFADKPIDQTKVKWLEELFAKLGDQTLPGTIQTKDHVISPFDLFMRPGAQELPQFNELMRMAVAYGMISQKDVDDFKSEAS